MWGKTSRPAATEAVNILADEISFHSEVIRAIGGGDGTSWLLHCCPCGGSERGSEGAFEDCCLALRRARSEVGGRGRDGISSSSSFSTSIRYFYRMLRALHARGTSSRERISRCGTYSSQKRERGRHTSVGDMSGGGMDSIVRLRFRRKNGRDHERLCDDAGCGGFLFLRR